MLKEITARHFDLTPEMKEAAEKAMDSLTRYYENIVSAEMVLDTERHLRKAELKVNVYNSTIAGSGETDDMYTSISQAVDKVITQLKKHKGKLKHKNVEKITSTKGRLTKPSTDVDEIDI